MKKLMEIVKPLHKRTKRDYLGRMMDDKARCMNVAKQYGKDYWDGDRRYGYGGYKYDGRWAAVAKRLIETYKLPADARILDVGCGKAHLLYELKKLLPQASIRGLDISSYALENAKEETMSELSLQRAQDKYPFQDKEFDLVISLTTLHNLRADELASALAEIERVGKNKYVVVESFRSDLELFNLQCWALTCATFFTPGEWQWFFDRHGYTGDFEFIYFE